MDGGIKQAVENIDEAESLVDSDAAEDLQSLTPTAKAGSRVKGVIAVGGGKGGIGKSLLASSLAITLARHQQKVVAMDLDLGGANLHTALGVELPAQTLSDFFARRTEDLESCMVATEVSGLFMISGAQDSTGVADINRAQKARLIQRLHSMDVDYIVLDLGAGTSNNTLDFFLAADTGIITLLPEPTSIENAYRFIKSAYYRRLRMSSRLSSIHGLIDAAMDSKNQRNIKSPSDLYREVNKLSPEMGLKLKEEIERFKPKLVINQARTQTDIDIGFSIKTVCKKYFGIDMEYAGYLDYDSAVWQSVRRKRPLILEFPNSRLVSNIDRIVQHLLKRNGGSR